MPTLYIAVTNHGFGHATRAASVAKEVQQRCQELGLPLRLILATKAPDWLLNSYLSGDYSHRPVSFDVGVLQSDSLTMDKPATLKEMRAIQDMESCLIEEEAAFLEAENVDLVLADIPPMMGKIARSAGVPCWFMGNFGWDFIYRPWGGEYHEFAAIADWIGECFSQGDRTFRLPFCEPMSALPNIIDVGLTGGTPTYAVEYLQSLLNRDIPVERTVLLTFGGLGLSAIPYEALAPFPDWQFITFDQTAPELPNLYKVIDRKMRPVDWMVVCDRIVSKPGYSTFAEACLLDKGVITITREGFAEAQILIEGIQDYAPHRIVDAKDFFSGDWSFLTSDLLPPRKSEKLDKNGQAAIASAIVEHLQNLS
ncbi:MAG: glycosyl transferase [Cyanobacteria bacterium P01_A01_bin.116]